MDNRTFFKRVGYTAQRLGEIMGFSRGQVYNILSGKTKPTPRVAEGVRAVKRQLEREYAADLAVLNERYADRRAAVEQLIYDESEEDDEEA